MNSRKIQKKRKRRNRKVAFRFAILFLIIAIVVMVGINIGKTIKDSGESANAIYPGQVLNKFYSEDENSLDGIYVGSSGAYRFWVPVEAFDKYGMAVYTYGCNSMPIAAIKYAIKDCLKTQKPRFIVVELRNITKIAENTESDAIKGMTDYMPLSKNRGDTIEALLDFAMKNHASAVSLDKTEYYRPNKNLSREEREEKHAADTEFVNNMGRYKGFPISESSFTNMPITPLEYTDALGDLESYYEEILTDLLDYCDGLDCNVLFVAGPHVAGSERQAKLNTACKMIRERGYEALNYNSIDWAKKIGLNYNTDYYNHRHLNIKGAIKYTDYLAAWLSEEFDIKDHRGDGDYKSWEDAYQEFKTAYEKGTDEMIHIPEVLPKELR